ncbi:MAG: pyridoxamine 5'-phosphate oxidase family protein [Ilumatobacter sp.]|uniref:pyridoxamine 5'-phosphate oxidase family protein n=1 Tax=Ilumatobacter sp. TaxID=1967498 RepID=UPI003297A9FC
MTTDPSRPLPELMKGGTTLMVATRSADGEVDSRPLTVADVSGSTIRILIDTTADWARQLTDGDWTHVTLCDTRSNDFASLTGTFTTTTDPAEIDELWNPFAGAYFDDGRESVGIAVMDIAPERGEYWDSPSGRIGSLISLVKAKLGDGEDSGEHGDVSV